MYEEFLKNFNQITTLIGVICTGLTANLGGEWILFAGYLILSLLDYLTGTIKAKVKRVENSNKGLKRDFLDVLTIM